MRMNARLSIAEKEMKLRAGILLLFVKNLAFTLSREILVAKKFT
jgi:hypothetical protein